MRGDGERLHMRNTVLGDPATRIQRSITVREQFAEHMPAGNTNASAPTKMIVATLERETRPFRPATPTTGVNPVRFACILRGIAPDQPDQGLGHSTFGYGCLGANVPMSEATLRIRALARRPAVTQG